MNKSDKEECCFSCGATLEIIEGRAYCPVCNLVYSRTRSRGKTTLKQIGNKIGNIWIIKHPNVIELEEHGDTVSIPRKNMGVVIKKMTEML